MGGDEEKIEELQKQVNNNTLEITKINSAINSDWKSNKELFEMVQGLQGEIVELNQNINRYNGLIEDRKEDREMLEDLHCRIDEMENEEEVKSKIIDNWKSWLGWAIATFLSLLKAYEIIIHL